MIQTMLFLLMTKKKPYFPNNWEAMKNTPAEAFRLPNNMPLTFEDFMSWKIGGWELPSSVSCIIRKTDLESGKVKEYVYRNAGSAKKKLMKLMEAGDSEFAIANHDEVHFLTPKYKEEYNDFYTEEEYDEDYG